MKARTKVLGVAAGAAGVAVAGAAARFAQQRGRIAHRPEIEHLPFGSLHTDPITVVADDGLLLHAEIEDRDEAPRRSGRRPVPAPEVTIVFVHGYALSMDCWHFQRAGYRGLVRSVFFDQRSHGRSALSDSEHCTIEQLGHDLQRVLDDLTGDEPVVLVGHSMGGMTIMELAEQRPELFGTKVVGAALISTTGGDLEPARMIVPILPARLSKTLGNGVVGRLVRGLSFGSRAVDEARRIGRDIATVVTDRFAFGGPVPASYVDFVRDMLDETSFSVVADFFPEFLALDRWEHLVPLSRIPTAIIGGTADRLTTIDHSRKLHASINGSDLLECVGAGHLVIIERHSQVNAELDDLIDRAVGFAEEHRLPDDDRAARSS